MFGTAYFGATHYGPAYFPPGDIVIEDVGGGYGAGGDYSGRILPSLADYEKRIKDLLDKERAETLNEIKRLKKLLVKAETERLLDIQRGEIRQKLETELKLEILSESLLTIQRDLAEIDRRRAAIKLKAKIMRDDDEVMILLYG